MILTILIIILGIALAIVFFNRHKDEDKARRTILGLTAAIVVLAIVRLVMPAKGPRVSYYDTTLDREIGAVAADWIAEIATGDSAVIIVPISLSTPYLDARLKGFEERLMTHDITVLGVEDAYFEEATGDGSEEFDARAIGRALERHSDADIVISLAGFPVRNLDEIAPDLQEIEFYIFEGYRPYDWSNYLRNGVVDGIILQPADSGWADTSGSPEEVFERSYIFVTPENFAELRDRFDFE